MMPHARLHPMAPTSAARAPSAPPPLSTLALGDDRTLQAISCGAVFLGALTYIGNGPNFMVKAIADEAGYRTPSFFGYLLYACVILLPVYVLVTAVFFRP